MLPCCYRMPVGSWSISKTCFRYLRRTPTLLHYSWHLQPPDYINNMHRSSRAWHYTWHWSGIHCSEHQQLNTYDITAFSGRLPLGFPVKISQLGLSIQEKLRAKSDPFAALNNDEQFFASMIGENNMSMDMTSMMILSMVMERMRMTGSGEHMWRWRGAGKRHRGYRRRFGHLEGWQR